VALAALLAEFYFAVMCSEAGEVGKGFMFALGHCDALFFNYRGGQEA